MSKKTGETQEITRRELVVGGTGLAAPSNPPGWTSQECRRWGAKCWTS
jgi:hypothetical protein